IPAKSPEARKPTEPARIAPPPVKGKPAKFKQSRPGARDPQKMKAPGQHVTAPHRAARKHLVKPAPPAPLPKKKVPPVPAKPIPTGPIFLSEGVTVKELAAKLDQKVKDVIKVLMRKGVLASINQNLEPDVALQICTEYGREAKIISFEEEVTIKEEEQEQETHLTPRHPVVTIMGHVDHGKTSLLDAIRQSKIISTEAGHITQHIGAYHVKLKGGTIVFLDTPGHEAFTRMRARGAKVTDIVVLVVAADDGVMPQTVEAISHARAAEVPIVVAINKTDLPSANLDKVKQELAEQDLLCEEWGGQTVCVEVSAKTGTGLDLLLEMIQLVAELQDLKANPSRLATGVVLEGKLDKGRGAVATVLVQNGMLGIGDPFVAGSVYGKVRAMYNEYAKKVDKAGPSHPVEVIGLQGVPQPGDLFQVIADDWKARQIGSFRQSRLRDEAMVKSSRVTLEQLYERIREGSIKELALIVKGDVHGSVEVISDTLQKLSTDKVRIKIIHAAPGGINEHDVLLASASNAIIIGFNVRPTPGAKDLARHENVDIRLYSVIYEIDAVVKKAMEGMLEPTTEEVTVGSAEVRDVFRIPKVGNIAGCFIRDGKLLRDAKARIIRDHIVIYTGRIGSLKRFKEDTTEVRAGYECGVGIERFNDIKVGDVIEAFKVVTVKPS
ncbi:translation initiation factor IF-2, partial [Acidobacteriota bacterium]